MELSVTLVSLALRAQIDRAIVVSADTDIIPAIDEVLAHSPVSVELAAWHNGKWGQRMKLPGRSIWVNWLLRTDYGVVEDATLY